MAKSVACDAVVIGGGPAGMVTATLLAEDGWHVSLVDGLPGGGRTMVMELVHDLPAAEADLTGPVLASRLLERTMDAGVDMVAEAARAIHPGRSGHTVELDGSNRRAPVVVVATGTTDGCLGLEEEDSFIGRGISHCASCDAPLFGGDEVLVVGDGDWAVEEVLILAKYAGRVTFVIPGERLSCSRARLQRLGASGNVEILTATEVIGLEADGDDRLAAVRLRRRDRHWRTPARAVIPLTGQQPNTDIVPADAARDSRGYLLTWDTNTNIAGLYAAGDVIRPTHQTVGSALSDAVVAARTASAYLTGH